MKIIYSTGNIVDSNDYILVNTVNCVGVMGKGVALAFKERYGNSLMLPYRNACSKKILVAGGIYPLTLKDPLSLKEKLIINFATKNHWKDPSKYEWIEAGLIRFKKFLKREFPEGTFVDLITGISDPLTISIPRLGCGNGGLNWAKVEPMIVKTFEDTNYSISLYS